MKKITALCASLVFLTAGSVSAAAAGDRYNPNTEPIPSGMVQVQIAEEDVVNSISWMHTALPNDPNIDPKTREEAQKTCKDLADIACDIKKDARLGISAQSILPNCLDAKGSACVESLEVGSAEKDFVAAKFIQAANPENRLAADPSSGLVEGSGPLVFDLEGQKYAAIFKVNQQYNRSSGKFGIYNFSGIAIPIRLSGPAQNNNCVFELDGQCAIAQDFDAGVKLRVKFSIPNSIGGWFRGRLKDPILSIEPGPSGYNKVTIEAEAVSVPRLAVPRDPALMQGDELKWYRTYSRWGTKNGLASGIDSSMQDAFNYVDFYRPIVKDAASGVHTSWILNTIPAGSGSSCLKDTSKLLGIVTTNSMVYSGSSPAFEGGFLNYKVAGMHYLPGGNDLALGTYDLVMRSETARCLYGFSKAPVSATVSILGGDSSSIATTVVRERNGWLKLAAYGFTFSNKTLQVKMTQSSAAAKKTITCLKGKTSKKVTAVSPKCPSGFKKK